MNIWGYIGAGVAAIGAFLAIFLKGKQSGKDEEQAKQNEKAVQQAVEAKQTRDDVASLNDAQRSDELRKYFHD